MHEGEGAPAVWRVGVDAAAPRALPAVAPAAYPGEVRPDGTEVVVVGVEEGPDGHRETLWAVPLDGRAPRLLAPPAGRVRSPTWTADGDVLIVEADWRSYGDLYRVPAQGGEPGRLTVAPHGSFEPAVAGGRLAFGTSRDGNAEVYLGGLDAADAVAAAPHPGSDTRPHLSPDGRALAWVSDRDGSAAVWIVDGGAPRRLRPPTGGVDLDLAWSPTGDRLALTVQTGPGELVVEVVGVDGRSIARLDGPGVDEHPAWSPDGAWIAFDSARTGDTEVWLARADGADARALTHTPGPDWLPRWVR